MYHTIPIYAVPSHLAKSSRETRPPPSTETVTINPCFPLIPSLERMELNPLHPHPNPSSKHFTSHPAPASLKLRTLVLRGHMHKPPSPNPRQLTSHPAPRPRPHTPAKDQLRFPSPVAPVAPSLPLLRPTLAPPSLSPHRPL